MRELDDTDRNILRLLLEDGRRPYSEIADRVGVSPPTVSDRVERLQDLGVINRFTLDLDRARFDDGLEVLIDVELSPDAGPEIRERFAMIEGIEQVFATADGRLTVVGVLEDTDVQSMVSGAVDADAIVDYEVDLLTETIWTPHVGDGTLDLDCTECSSDVIGDPVSVTYDGETRHFCTEGCRERYEDRRRVAESA